MNPEGSVKSTDGVSTARIDVALLVTAAFLIAAYVVARFQGLWQEIDTGNASRYIRLVADSGRLVPGAEVYPNGYGYQALAVFLIDISGVSLHDLQGFGSLIMVIWLIWPAWMLYRELTESRWAATFATAILLFQPEFLFGVLRGTHEKFTRGLMLLCLYLLVRSFRSRHQPARFAALVLAFYLAVYALIAFNNLLAASFLLAMLAGLALFAVVSRRLLRSSKPAAPGFWRLANVLFTSLVLTFLFTFYAYKPAEHDLYVLQSTVDRVLALALDVGTKAVNPYAQWVVPAWESLPVYLVMTLANWLLLVLSAAIWLWQSVKWLTERGSRPTEGQVLLWAFYGAFAAIGAVSIVVDFSGALSGNLQHRTFPTFAVLAAPLVASWVVERLSHGPLPRRRAYAAVGICVACLAVLSTLKATNEPTLGNKWLFYGPEEMVAVKWGDAKLTDRALWVGFDERLFAAGMIVHEGRLPLYVADSYPARLGTRNFIISDVNRAAGERLGLPLPVLGDDSITYDNGKVQIFQRRPRTEYQR